MRKALILCLFLAPMSLLFAQVKISQVIVGNYYGIGAMRYGQTINCYVTYACELNTFVRIHVTPYSEGEPTDLHVSTPSPQFSGEGTYNRSFMIVEGSADDYIDEVRIHVVNDVNGETLLDFYKPVQFHLGDVHFYIEDLNASQQANSFHLDYDAPIQMYKQLLPGSQLGVAVRGFYQGQLVTSQTGAFLDDDSGFFVEDVLIPSGVDYVKIDELRFSLSSGVQGQPIKRLSLPVNWIWSRVRVRTVQHSDLQWPLHGEEVQTDFEVRLMDNTPARVLVRPMSRNKPVDNAVISPSPQYLADGDAQSNFTVQSGNVLVDGVQFEFYNRHMTEFWGSITYPKRYAFGEYWPRNVSLNPPSPARIPVDGPVLEADFTLSNDSDELLYALYRPHVSTAATVDGGLIGPESYSVEMRSSFRPQYESEIEEVSIVLLDFDDVEEQARFSFPAKYHFDDGLPGLCDAGVDSLTRPVGLTKSFRPVPYPSGNVDRVQLKWYAVSTGGVSRPYGIRENIGCDIQFWPVRDLVTGEAISPSDSVSIDNVSKPSKELFKWPIKFQSATGNNAKKLAPSTRYRWRVRCGCDQGSRAKSSWSDIKVFNTPAFDPVTGIYTPPGDMEFNGEDWVKRNLGQSTVQLFPNPVNDRASIQVKEEVLGLQIVDMSGRLVYEHGTFAKDFSPFLSLTHLPSGAYVLRVQFANHLESIPLMKQ